MRIVLATYGSEGDVRPMLALAAGLSGSGHEVVVVAEGAAASLADRIGVEFHALAGDIRSILSSGAHGTGEVMRTGRPRLTTLTRMARLHSGEWLETIDAAAGGADAILGSSLVVYHALSVAHARRVGAYGW